MPKDLWKRDRDRQISKLARQEFAERGCLTSYESFRDDFVPEDRVIEVSELSAGDEVVFWLNKLRHENGKIGRRIERFVYMPKAGDESAIPLLQFALGGRKPDFRLAVILIKQIGLPAVSAIAELLCDNDELTATNAIKALGGLGKIGLPAIPRLEAIADYSPVYELRMQARLTLERFREFGYRSVANNVEKFLAVIEKIDAKKLAEMEVTDADVKRGAIRQLCQIAENQLSSLLRYLIHGSAHRRRIVALVLQKMPQISHAGIRVLERASETNDDILRNLAQKALSKHRLPCLMRMLGGNDPSERREATEGLKRLTSEARGITSLLSQQLFKKNDKLILAILEIFNSYGVRAESAVPSLFSLLRQGNLRIKPAILETIRIVRPTAKSEVEKPTRKRRNQTREHHG